MLEGLERIDWESLGHAYGPAGDVPGLVRGLASVEKKVRDDSLRALWGNIWHQGSVYEATAHAVPFLIELASSEKIQDRDLILIFLAALANGTSYLDVHQHLTLFKDIHGAEMETESWQMDLARERSWVQATRSAVANGKDVFIRMVDHPDWKVRESAAYLLASLGKEAAEAATVLAKRLACEQVARARISFLLALGPLGAETLPHLERAFASEREPAAKLAAALSIVGLARERATESTIGFLIDALSQAEEFEPSYEGSPWIDADLETLISSFLQAIGPERGAAAVPAIVRALNRSNAKSARRIARALLGLLFGEKKTETKQSQSELTEAQREALRAICKSSGAWSSKFDMAEALRWAGLPETRTALEKFLK